MLHCYTELVWSRTKTAEAVLAISDRYPVMRQLMGGSWRLLRAWSISEPTDLHPPCPLKLLQAMVVGALAWGWPETAAVLLLAFYALLRPIEYLSVTWGDLALPVTHNAGIVIFVGIPHHKTQRRGPRQTHVRVDHAGVVQFLTHRAKGPPALMPIWPNSVHTWRRRAKLLCENLTGADKTILPSSFRPGAASYFFEAWNEDIGRLQWRGRWDCKRTLKHYIQELMVHQVLRDVPSDKVTRIDAMAGLFDDMLRVHYEK